MNDYLTWDRAALLAHVQAEHTDHTNVVDTFDSKALSRWHSFDHACATSTGDKDHHA